jgi:hypothetical protein
MNVLIREFQYNEAQAVSASVAPPLSQLSQMSQMSKQLQMSHYSANHLDMAGYPFSLRYGMQSNQSYKHKETVLMGYGFGPSNRFY